MSKQTITGFVHARPAKSYELGDTNIIDGHRMDFFTWDDMEASGFVLVGPATIEFEIPEGWDPRAQQVDALKTEKERLKAEYTKAVTKIDQQINSLLALEAA